MQQRYGSDFQSGAASMTAAQSQLTQDFPEKNMLLQKLRQENPAFALKAEEYESLSQRIASGEGVDSATLAALKQEQANLKNDIARQLKHASGSCCGGCGG
jgi:uncharacterized protein YdcH (DUF465 family)